MGIKNLVRCTLDIRGQAPEPQKLPNIPFVPKPNSELSAHEERENWRLPALFLRDQYTTISPPQQHTKVAATSVTNSDGFRCKWWHDKDVIDLLIIYCPDALIVYLLLNYLNRYLPTALFNINFYLSQVKLPLVPIESLLNACDRMC